MKKSYGALAGTATSFENLPEDTYEAEITDSYFRLANSGADMWHVTFTITAGEHAGRKVPYTCTQCAEAWCLHACPVEAIKVDLATGAKVVHEASCVGCKVCTIACPFGTVNYVAETGKVQKCDLCGGDPACATACPTGAISYIDSDWTGLDKMRQWAGKTDSQPRAS